jgi:hydroxymethylbilane synthase
VRRSRRPIVIASRQSPLARAQAQAIGRALVALHPGLKVDFHWVESEGDRLTEGPLANSGGKGLFAKSIEIKVLEGSADLAVHSLKDLPASADEQTPGLVIAAIPTRADVRDCLVVRPALAAASYLADLPHACTLGTASPRRAAQALRLRPDLKIQLIRGNVHTRLDKVLSQNTYDATLMAVAGLRRAGLADHARRLVDPHQIMPAACQGALALQCKSDDHVTLWRCLPLNDPLSSQAVHAERQVVAALGAGCHSPVCVLAQHRVEGSSILFDLHARVLSPDGARMAHDSQTGSSKQVSRMVQTLLSSLKNQGATEILRMAL